MYMAISLLQKIETYDHRYHNALRLKKSYRLQFNAQILSLFLENCSALVSSLRNNNMWYHVYKYR